MDRNPWFRALIVILVFIAGIYLTVQVLDLIGQFSSILVILFLAWLLAFVLKPLANALYRWRLPFTTSVALVYVALLLGIIVAVVVLAPITVEQMAQIGQALRSYDDQLSTWVGSLQAQLNQRNIQIDLATLVSAQNIGAQLRDVGALVVENSINLVTGLASALLSTVVVLVLSFYFMLDGTHIIGILLDLVPDSWQTETRFLLNSIDRKFGGFLRGQLIQSILYGIGTAAIMAIFGMDYVLIASLVAGLLMFIPFFGPILGFIPPALIAVLSLPFGSFIIVVIALLVLQQVVLNVIAPKVMSDAVGMHPILVFLAILLGVRIAGPLGAVFGVPFVAVINAMVVLFYNRSESIQRRRARRLGLVPHGPPQPPPPHRPVSQGPLVSLFRQIQTGGSKLLASLRKHDTSKHGGNS